MINSDLNNENLDDEIDLGKLLRTILNSKKLIIIVTLAFSLLGFIYSTQEEPVYQSTVILEVGSYDLINGEKKLVWPVSTLIKKLRINQISKQLGELNFNSIEDHFLEINYISLSPEFNENILKEAIKFAQESHTLTLENIVNSFSRKIVTIDSEVEYIKNSIKDQQESQKLIAINSMKRIDNAIPALEAKIKYLLKLIPEEENNLLLLESDAAALLLRASSSPTLQQIIYSYNEQIVSLKNQLKDLQQEKEALELQIKSIAEDEFVSEELFKFQQEKEALEMQIKSIAEDEFVSEELFKLSQEKDTLELQIKLVNDQTNSTKPIREIITSEITPNQLLTILIGTILGFIFSIFIVFIRQAFLKEQN